MASILSKAKKAVKSVVSTVTSAGKKVNNVANASSAVGGQTIAPVYQGPSINTTTGKSTYGGQTLAPVYQGPAIDTRTGGSNIGPQTRVPANMSVAPTGSKGNSSSNKGQVLGASTASFQGPSIDGTTGASTFSRVSSPSTNLGSTNASSVPMSNVVNTPTLAAQNTKLTFNEPTPQDFSSLVPASIEPPLTEATKEKDTALVDYLKSLDDAPSSADAYAKAQRETDILQKQQLVSDLTGQLNGIVAKGQANQLSLVGQGRGIPEAIIGGQQAQIGRETAIAALPIQAQLSAAQGNLEMANDNLDTLFKIYSDDARNEFEAKREQKKMVYEIATAKEKRELDKLDKLEERAYNETQDLNEERSVYAKMAFANGQSSLGAKIAKLDYKSPTFKNELATLSSQIVDSERNLRIQKLQQDLANTGTTINPKVLNTTQFKAAQAAQNLKLTLEKAKAAVQKYGNYERLSGTGKGILNSIKVQLRSEISTALEQGVVVPGEAEAFDKIAGQINSSFLGIPNVRNSTTISSIESLSQSMDGRIALQKAALTNTYKVTPEQVDTLLNITDLSDQEFVDMDALIE